MSPPPRLILLALARNCAPYLGKAFEFADALIAAGERLHFFVGENGSSDKTRALIEARQRQQRDITLVDTAAMANIAERYDRMALGRDLVAAAARPVAHPDDIVILVDLDSVTELLPTPEELRAALELLHSRVDLAGVAATSRPFYYDLLALRWPGQFERNVGVDIDRDRRHPIAYYLTFRNLIYPEQRRISEARDRACTSAFNGMCLYKASDYFAQTYTSFGPLHTCEHVPFNEAICARGNRRILISDDLPLAMPAEHGPVSAPTFFARRALKALRMWRAI